VRRRGLLTAAAAALSAPWLIDAARADARRIGILSAGADPGRPPLEAKEFWAGFGWTLGETLLVERRYAGWRAERMPDLVDELLRRQHVEVLVSLGPDATGAAARATRTVPIVFSWAFSPIECGLVESYSRPGGNCTGVTASVGEANFFEKPFEYLRAAAPSARRVALLMPDTSRFRRGGSQLDIRPTAAAQVLGFEYSFHTARHLEGVDAILKEAAATRAQAALIGGLAYAGQAARVADFALRQRWVTWTPDMELRDAGLLMYQGWSTDSWDRVGHMVSRILRGAKPADIPVELPSTRSEFVLNLRTARAIELEVPYSLRLRADRVIE